MIDKTKRPPIEKRWWFEPAIEFVKKLVLAILNKKKK